MNRIDKYQILNQVQPFFEDTKYPYNRVTSKKIIFTQKEIDLVYQQSDKFFVTPEKAKFNKNKKYNHVKKEKRGSYESGLLNNITVYFYKL